MTIDEEISEGKADDIYRKGLVAYVPHSIAWRLRKHGKIWVKPLDDLPTDLHCVVGGKPNGQH